MKIIINDQMLHQSNVFAGNLTTQSLEVLSVFFQIFTKNLIN